MTLAKGSIARNETLTERDAHFSYMGGAKNPKKDLRSCKKTLQHRKEHLRTLGPAWEKILRDRSRFARL